MYSHVAVGTNDITRARGFYDAVLVTLGTERFFAGESHVGCGKSQGDQFWVLTPFDGAPASVGNGTHVAFLAPSWAAVDAFHAAALAHGGSDEGTPGLRPHYHPAYYGAYVRDPDGNKLLAVCHDPEG